MSKALLIAEDILPIGDLREHDRFVSSVYDGMADAEAGRTITDEALGERLDEVFGPE